MNNPEGYVLVQVKQLAQWREWANNVAAWSTKADRSSEVARLKASISNAMISATQTTASNAGERELDLYDEIECDMPSLFGRASLEGHESGQRLAHQVRTKMQAARAALASKPPQGEQKPVGEVLHDAKFGCKAGQLFIDLPVGTKLYSEPVAPPAREALPQKDQRITLLWQGRVDGTVEAFEINGMLAIPDAEGVTYLTREQSVEFFGAALSATPPAQAVQDSQAVRDVLTERERQKSVEGWTPEHDDEHGTASMAAAAGCYAFSAASEYAENTHWSNERFDAAEHLWPWDREWWKPSTPRRDLVKAGALIIAEIERLDRASRTRGNGVKK